MSEVRNPSSVPFKLFPAGDDSRMKGTDTRMLVTGTWLVGNKELNQGPLKFGCGYTKTGNQCSHSNCAKKVKIDCCLLHNMTVPFLFRLPR